MFILLSLIGCSKKDDSLVGDYMDSISQRAKMSLAIEDDKYLIVVSWSSSANEYTAWTMRAELKENQLVYEGEEIEIHSYNENGQEDIKYTASNNVGYFEIKDMKLSWLGAAQDQCKKCVFEKVDKQ